MARAQAYRPLRHNIQPSENRLSWVVGFRKGEALPHPAERDGKAAGCVPEVRT